MSGPLLRGRILPARTRDAHALEYLSYVPASAQADAPLLIAVHGYSRNATEQAALFAPLCERAGIVLAAPHFDAEAFPDYQRLGRRASRADRALDAMVAELRGSVGLLLGRIALFGYSGGGQFAHRYLMAYPSRVTSAVVAAPGWYTFPDREHAYPFGTRDARHRLGVRMRAEAFLRVPVLVAIGEQDDDEDSENLRHTPALDAQQGTSRLERATRWVRAMQDAAHAIGSKSQVRFASLPGAGHSFAECMDSGLGELVLEHMGVALAAAPTSHKRLVALP